MGRKRKRRIDEDENYDLRRIKKKRKVVENGRKKKSVLAKINEENVMKILQNKKSLNKNEIITLLCENKAKRLRETIRSKAIDKLKGLLNHLKRQKQVKRTNDGKYQIVDDKDNDEEDQKRKWNLKDWIYEIVSDADGISESQISEEIQKALDEGLIQTKNKSYSSYIIQVLKEMTRDGYFEKVGELYFSDYEEKQQNEENKKENKSIIKKEMIKIGNEEIERNHYEQLKINFSDDEIEEMISDGMHSGSKKNPIKVDTNQYEDSDGEDDNANMEEDDNDDNEDNQKTGNKVLMEILNLRKNNLLSETNAMELFNSYLSFLSHK